MYRMYKERERDRERDREGERERDPYIVWSRHQAIAKLKCQSHCSPAQ